MRTRKLNWSENSWRRTKSWRSSLHWGVVGEATLRQPRNWRRPKSRWKEIRIWWMRWASLGRRNLPRLRPKNKRKSRKRRKKWRRVNQADPNCSIWTKMACLIAKSSSIFPSSTKPLLGVKMRQIQTRTPILCSVGPASSNSMPPLKHRATKLNWCPNLKNRSARFTSTVRWWNLWAQWPLNQTIASSLAPQVFSSTDANREILKRRW